MVVRPLSKELQQLAIQKLNENPKRLQEDLKEIREWAKTLPHLKIRTDDQWIVSYLRACKFKLDLVKTKLESLATLKARTPEWFNNRDPFLPEMQELLKLGVCLPLPHTSDPAAPRVILFRDCPETLKFRVEDRAKLTFMYLDVLLYEDDNYVVAGYHILGDHKNICMKHIYQAQPSIMQKGYRIITKGYATRPKGFHGINLPWVAQVAFNTFKYYAPERLLSIVHIYERHNIEELYERIPISLLPKEYGGNGGSIEELIVKWKAKMEGYREWFLNEGEVCNENIESDEDDDEDSFEDAEGFEDEEYYNNEECFVVNSEQPLNSIQSFEDFLGYLLIG